jgi:hypothetical protein
MGEVVERLGVRAEHVVFGHSHRAGPLPDDPVDEWITASGTRLHNCGCWVYETHFIGDVDRTSPYWPGGAIEVGDAGPPVLRRLLLDAVLV